MNLVELFMRAREHAAELCSCWVVKSLGGFLIAAVYNLHVQLLLAFTGLVVIDLVSKWIALSRRYLTERRGKENPSLWACVLSMRKAHRARYIKSSEMKHRFAGKILVYAMIVLTGGLIDGMMLLLQKPMWAVTLLVGYLSVSEIISIVENLQDAGVKEAEQLHEILKKKMEGLKK